MDGLALDLVTTTNLETLLVVDKSVRTSIQQLPRTLARLSLGHNGAVTLDSPLLLPEHIAHLATSDIWSSRIS